MSTQHLVVLPVSPKQVSPANCYEPAPSPGKSKNHWAPWPSLGIFPPGEVRSWLSFVMLRGGACQQSGSVHPTSTRASTEPSGAPGTLVEHLPELMTHSKPSFLQRQCFKVGPGGGILPKDGLNFHRRVPVASVSIQSCPAFPCKIGDLCFNCVSEGGRGRNWRICPLLGTCLLTCMYLVQSLSWNRSGSYTESFPQELTYW